MSLNSHSLLRNTTPNLGPASADSVQKLQREPRWLNAAIYESQLKLHVAIFASAASRANISASNVSPRVGRWRLTLSLCDTTIRPMRLTSSDLKKSPSLVFPPKQHVFTRYKLTGKQRKHWLMSGATTLTHKKHNHRTFLDSERGKCRLVSLGTGGSILKLKFTVGPGQARRPNLSK